MVITNNNNPNNNGNNTNNNANNNNSRYSHLRESTNVSSVKPSV